MNNNRSRTTKSEANENHYEFIFENIQDILYETSADGTILEFSPSVEQILHYKRDELIGKSVLTLYAEPDSRDELIKIVRKQRQVCDYEVLLKRKDGAVINCSITAKIISGNNDAFSFRMIGSIRDISERKKAEKKLREAEELYETLAKKSFAGVYVLQNGLFSFINSRAASFAGYPEAELIGTKALDIVHPEDRKYILSNSKAMLRGERNSPYEFRILTKDGQTRWLMETVTPIIYQGKPAVLGNLMDTSWTLSRVDLEIVRSIIEAVPDGVFVADKDGYYVAANEGFERITMIDRNELAGKHSSYLVENRYIEKAINLMVLKDNISKTEVLRYPSGQDVLVSATSVFDKHKRVIGVVSCLRDLTELNNMQKRMQQSHLLIEQYKKRLDLLEEKLEPAATRFVSESDEAKNIVLLSKRVAGSDATVLIKGESGVGKEVIARYIHENSNRKKYGTFVKIDCAALPASLLESELFGYEKGSYTNARKEGKQGLFETANKGTLFLDEIGELPFELQSKLLNAIQDKEIKRIGGLINLPIDVRIIAATNRNLEHMIEERKFRQDLYYRLNVIQINIPPLRERRSDIEPLIYHYIEHFNKIYKAKKYIVPEGIRLLIDYGWPGNVRELKNIIERLVIMYPNDEIKVGDIRSGMKIYDKGEPLQVESAESRERVGSLKVLVSQFERDIIEKALSLHGNMIEAAKDLKIDISTLTRKKKKLSLTKRRENLSLNIYP